jgi:hypothetical protein
MESHFVERCSPEDSSVVELVETGCLVGNWQVMCHLSEAQGDICNKPNRYLISNDTMAAFDIISKHLSNVNMEYELQNEPN